MKIQISLSGELTVDQIKDCFHQVFPNSMLIVRSGFGGGTCFSLYLAKDLSEVPNRIIQNDPLSYSAWLKDTTWSEESVSLAIKSEEKHLAFGRAKLRSKTIKNVDKNKLMTRLHELRTFVLANAHLLVNPMFDIHSK